VDLTEKIDESLIGGAVLRMAEVKPAEVSAILRQQLSGFKSEADLEEVGTVLQVGDGIARIYGLKQCSVWRA